MSGALSDEQINQLRAELRGGRKLVAVKLYKTWTGSSLLEAKNFVEGLADDNVPAASGDELQGENMDDILDAIQNGRKLEAVKLYKHSSGRSLKESKDFIENLMKELEIEDPGSVPSGSGCSGVVLMMVGLVMSVAGAVLLAP